MARTIGQLEKGIILEETADTRERDLDFDRELERSRREGERVSQQTEYSAYLGKGLKWYTNPQSNGIAYDSATDAINAQRMASIVNDDDITIDTEMVEIINDQDTKIVDGEITRRIPTGRDVIRRSGQFRRDLILPKLQPKRKSQRKPSKYGKTLGKQIEKLKKKHPRTDVTKLMTKAHAATRKALGMPPKRKRRKK